MNVAVHHCSNASQSRMFLVGGSYEYASVACGVYVLSQSQVRTIIKALAC
jgi:hypothetical protein